MTSAMVTALALEGPDETDVTLLLHPYRRVERIEGLGGVRVRKAKRPRTGRHGSVDRSKLRDDAVITITGSVTGEDADRAWLEYDAITRAFVGAVDTYRLLKWSNGTERHLQMAVKLDEMQAPVEVGPDMVRYQVTVSGADPNGYSQELEEVSGEPLATGGGGGLRFPEMFPIVFSPSSGGQLSVTNEGTAPTPPTFLLHGYLRNPIIRLGDRQLTFVGEIGAGDTLHVNAADRTVMLNGTADRGNLLKFEDTRWFDLPVGTSVVTLLAEDFGAGSGLDVQYRHAHE
jgi:hypothetical protein